MIKQHCNTIITTTFNVAIKDASHPTPPHTCAERRPTTSPSAPSTHLRRVTTREHCSDTCAHTHSLHLAASAGANIDGCGRVHAPSLACVCERTQAREWSRKASRISECTDAHCTHLFEQCVQRQLIARRHLTDTARHTHAHTRNAHARKHTHTFTPRFLLTPSTTSSNLCLSAAACSSALSSTGARVSACGRLSKCACGWPR
jgi:hypothetical protein